MKIALIGYGKVGKLIDVMSQERGHEVVARLDSKRQDMDLLSSADVCIEFTRPEAAVDNIKTCAALQKNIVVGTTGWYDRIDEIEGLAEDMGILYAPNFSLGVFLWLKMVRQSAALMERFKDYEVEGLELHHRQKKDAPSGTALMMESVVKEEMQRVKKLETTSIRKGALPGTHSLIFNSPLDSITITHEARNRKGFAQGAILAAEWLKGKKGLYTLEDMWKDV